MNAYENQAYRFMKESLEAMSVHRGHQAKLALRTLKLVAEIEREAVINKPKVRSLV